MLFPRCNDIHMWFMRISIDVVFLRKDEAGEGAPIEGIYRITSTHREVPPGKVLPLRDGAANNTLELPAGTIARRSLDVGDCLHVKHDG
jgi:uncharacterized membrane protein (UPF0127 family)